MFRVDFNSIRAGLGRIEAVVRGVSDRLNGTATVTILPAPDGRSDGRSNIEILGYLSRRHPGLLSVRGGEIDRAVRARAKASFDPRRSTLADVAEAGAQAIGPILAARLEGGSIVTNTPETLARKAREGHGTTPGVETGQLADALRNASVKVEQ